MEFLSSNFGWLFLAGVVLVIPTFALSLWGFVNSAADMPSQMKKIIGGTTVEDRDEPADEVEAITDMFFNFFKSAFKHFFGPNFLRMLPAMVVGIFTSVLFLGAVLGLLIRILS